jgi:hypothetical protein
MLHARNARVSVLHACNACAPPCCMPVMNVHPCCTPVMHVPPVLHARNARTPLLRAGGYARAIVLHASCIHPQTPW